MMGYWERDRGEEKGRVGGRCREGEKGRGL
jgi:hypothetical protein